MSADLSVAQQKGAGPLRASEWRQQPDLAMAWLGMATCIVLAGIVPALILYGRNLDQVGSYSLLLSLMLIAISGCRIGLIIFFSKLEVFALTFWLFVYVAMSVAPLAQLVTQLSQPLISGTIEQAFVGAQEIVLAGSISYELGRRVPYFRKTNFKASSKLLSANSIATLTSISGLASVAYVSYLGPASFFESRQDLADSYANSGLRSDSSQVSSAIVGAAGTVPILFCLIFCIAAIRLTPASKRPATLWLSLAVSLGLNLIVNNPISSPRFWSITVIFGILFALIRVSARKLAVLILLGIFGAIFLFPYADYFRRASDDRQEFSTSSPLQALAVKDYDQMVMTANGREVVRETDFTRGRQLAGAFAFWLPRSAWTDKPADTGTLIGQRMSSANTNLSSPLWVEFYFDFSFPGVIVGFIVFGTVSATLDSYFQSQGQGSILSLTLPVISGYQLIILRGPLLQAMGKLFVLVALTGILLFLTQRARSE